VLGTQEAYQPGRGRIAKTAVINSDASLLDAQTMVGLHDWLALGFGEGFEIVETMGAKLCSERQSSS